jgi:predicted ribosome quality control (RQC) complex YloA/Tae2 family protein
MEPKRELSSVDLAAIETELNRHQGAKVDKVYLYGESLLRIKMRDFDRGRVELLVEVSEQKRAHTTDPDTIPDAPGRPPNFAMKLRNRLRSADFLGVEQYEFDRILRFEFAREDGNTTIIAELFGEGNIAVVDQNGSVLQCLETIRLNSRTVAPGSQYEFPSSRINPLALSYDQFVKQMEDSDTDVVRTLATQLNLGGLYAEEVCARAGVKKTTDIDATSASTYDGLFEALQRVREDIAQGEFSPRVYYSDGDPVDVTPLPLEEYEQAGLTAESYSSFMTAVDTYFKAVEDPEDDAATETDDKPDFEAEIAKQERIISQQEGAIESFETEAQAHREKAELLYGNYNLVDNIITTIREAREADHSWDDIRETLKQAAPENSAAAAVSHIDGSTGTVTVTLEGNSVPLRIRDGVEKNADRLYTEAKRVEEKKTGALEALEQTRAELEAVKQRKDEWDASGEDKKEQEQQSASTGPDDDLDYQSMDSIPIRRNEQWYEEFRWFHTSDGFLVIGGRNATQNEMLVEKYLEPHDRFFHTQAQGGPVTILKATGPSEAARSVAFPDQTLAEAAQFAVSYSSVWKDGRFAGEAYMVKPDQVSKTPESGEYIEKGSFVVRGDRTYYRDVEAEVAVGIQCEDITRVIGGPPAPVEEEATVSLRFKPGQYAQNDAGKLAYRRFRRAFTDESFVRKIASPDQIQEFLPPGTSDILDDS